MRLRYGIGWIGVSLLIGSAAHYVSRPEHPTQDTRKSPSTSSKKNLASRINKTPKSPLALETGSYGCRAYETANDSAEGHKDQGDASRAIDGFLRRSPSHLKYDSLTYIIAPVPDPRHTRLAMLFDRSIDAISDSASDSGYRYDSYWFPWKVERQKYDSREDQQAEIKSIEDREKCPGFILFRRTTGLQTDDPYDNGLLVFVVSEQPTGGLNADQWQFAADWVNAHQEINPEKPLRVLGPTFSGTLPSLAAQLKAFRPPGICESQQQLACSADGTVRRTCHEATKPKWGDTALVFSGTVGSCQSIKWFQKEKPPGTQFRIFQENDELQLSRLFDYFTGQNQALKNVAILSEDETAYGNSLDTGKEMAESKGESGCDLASYYARYAKNHPGHSLRSQDDLPVSLFYPRDISALRAAYQSQSIFAQTQQGAEKQAPHTVLSGELENEANEEGDTPASYSTQQSALSQEAELLSVVNFLRAHHSSYIVLRGSNPLDYLFLTRFLHHAYPQGQVIIVGSEILFTRELDTTELRGSLTLTNFPLLARLPHWSQILPGWSDDNHPVKSHGHRVYPSTNSEGLYAAARFLIKQQFPEKPSPDPFFDTIPDFTDAAWLHQDETRSSALPGNSNTWLTVLGRDGYWPVALLKDPGRPNPRSCLAAAVENGLPEQQSTEAGICTPGHYRQNAGAGMDPPMPWWIALTLSVMLILLHTLRCSHRIPKYAYLPESFHWKSEPAAGLLVAISTSLVFMTVATLFAPFGAIDRTELYLVIAIGAFGSTFSAAKGFKAPFFVGSLLSPLVFLPFIQVNLENYVSRYYRSIHLTDGVSPLLPMLFLITGLYAATCHALAGYRLLGAERPKLPEQSMMTVEYVRASQAIAEHIEKFAKVFASDWKAIAKLAVLPIVVGVSIAMAFRSLPISSFEGPVYGKYISCLVFTFILLITAGSARLLLTWRALKQLLQQLQRMPLTRTFIALQGISGKSLWSMTIDVPRTQYEFLARQLNAGARLVARLPYLHEATEVIASTDKESKAFSKRYLKDLNQDAKWTQEFRALLARCSACILQSYLREAWDEEREKRDEPGGKQTGIFEVGTDCETSLSKHPGVRAAEEFVSLLYVSYIQTILARMRTIVFSMSSLTVCMMLSVAFYPFPNRPLIAVWMLAVLIFIGIVVAIVYAGLERDHVLSHITNTKSELGREFWTKYATFLLPPVLALLTAQFPEIATSIQHLVQPALDAGK